MALAIKVENVSKIYQLGSIGTGTLSRDIERWIAKYRGKDDPFLKIGEVNDRTSKGSSDIVWSLKDLNFQIEQGTAIGIIGRNGAGKSTLLKILSRVTSPTAGIVRVKGRIASLLEVGTGFHPELSGRENIFLNGAILGMRKAEIKQKFDQIVDFAGVDRYIDTPVKRYSSGMYVRLAFSVAAHLEAEILIVDEILAVGDTEFQKKCLGKMEDVSKGQGKTVLFVSHNMGAIKNLCNRVAILQHGQLVFEGNVTTGIDKYINFNSGSQKHTYYAPAASSLSYIKSIELMDSIGSLKSEFKFTEEIIIHLLVKIDRSHLSANVGFKVHDNLERVVFTSEVLISDFTDRSEEVFFKIKIPSHTLTPNLFKLQFALHIPNKEIIELLTDVVHFSILDTSSTFYQFSNSDIGCVYIDCKWIKAP